MADNRGPLTLFEGSFEYKNTVREFSLEEEGSDGYIDSLTKESRLSVLATLARTRKGFNTDLVTPIIGSSEPDKLQARTVIRDAVLKVVDKLTIEPGMTPLLDAERILASKVGPLSIMLPFAQRRSDLYRYYAKPQFTEEAYHICLLAHDRIKRRLPHHKLEPISLNDAFIKMPKGTNLGGPFFRKSKEYYPALMKLAGQFEKSGFDTQKYRDPCMLYWRGQSTGLTTPVKQRGVWGYPHYVSLHEGRIMAPIVELFKQTKGFSALVSNDAVNRRVTQLINLKEIKYSIDFSSFDQFGQALVHLPFDTMRWMYKRKYHDIIDMVEDRFLNIPLLTPDGIWNGKHGVPSGAGPTNFADSYINWVLAEANAISAETELIDWEFQGDDGLWVFKEDPGLTAIQEFVHSMGMYVGVDKGGVSSDIVLYLQNVHLLSHIVDGLNVGMRPLEKLLPGLLGFETARDRTWRPVDTSFRWLQQVENAKFHPYFENIVRFLYQYDRLLREFTINELIDIGGGLTEIEAREKSEGFPYGKEPLSTLGQFASVLIIDKLRKQHGGKVPSGDWWAE